MSWHCGLRAAGVHAGTTLPLPLEGGGRWDGGPPRTHFQSSLASYPMGASQPCSAKTGLACQPCPAGVRSTYVYPVAQMSKERFQERQKLLGDISGQWKQGDEPRSSDTKSFTPHLCPQSTLFPDQKESNNGPHGMDKKTEGKRGKQGDPKSPHLDANRPNWNVLVCVCPPSVSSPQFQANTGT